MNQIESAGVIVYRMRNNQHEYLLIHSIKGHWDFPKGKREKDETLLQTAIRELHEETGLTATLVNAQLTPIGWIFMENGIAYYKTGTFFIGYVTPESAVQLSPEHNGFTWLPYAQAYETLTHATSRNLLAQAEKTVCVLLRPEEKI